MPPTVGALPFDSAYDDQGAPQESIEAAGAGGGGGGSSPVPEPGALFLVGTGLLGVALTARLRRRDRKPEDDIQSN